MNKIKNWIPEILLAVSAILIIGAIYVWAPVCTKLLELKTGKLIHMNCHHSAVASVILAVIMLGILLESFIYKKKSVIVPCLIGIALFIVMKDTPLSLGMCKMPSMACNKTLIWIDISGIMAILSGLSAWAFERKKNKDRTPQLD